MRPAIRLALLTVVAFPASLLAAQLRVIPSSEAGWPQFRGPRRDGTCDEKGLLEAWPEAGPRPLWTATDLGSGYASPVLAGGRIYIAGDVGDKLHIFFHGRFRLPGTGRRKDAWTHPVILEGRLYLRYHEALHCYDVRARSDGGPRGG